MVTEGNVAMDKSGSCICVVQRKSNAQLMVALVIVQHIWARNAAPLIHVLLFFDYYVNERTGFCTAARSQLVQCTLTIKDQTILNYLLLGRLSLHCYSRCLDAQ